MEDTNQPQNTQPATGFGTEPAAPQPAAPQKPAPAPQQPASATHQNRMTTRIATDPHYQGILI